MSESDDLSAVIRAKERAELDRKIDQYRDDPVEAVCVYCGRRWFTSHALGRTFIAKPLREAGGCIAHLICWGQHEDDRARRDDAVRRYLRKAVP